MSEFEKLQNNFIKLRKAGYSLRQLARPYPGITFGDVSRIIRGIEPKSPAKRVALGLPRLGSAPMCPRCGVVHVGRCTAGRHVEKSLFDQPVKELRWRFDHRETLQEGRQDETVNR
jgi:hypothetical protein